MTPARDRAAAVCRGRVVLWLVAADRSSVLADQRVCRRDRFDRRVGRKSRVLAHLRQANVSHDPVAAKKLIAELNRTLVVAQDQLGDQPIEAAYLYVRLAEHPALVEQLRSEFSLPVTLIDPFATLAEPPRECRRIRAASVRSWEC